MATKNESKQLNLELTEVKKVGRKKNNNNMKDKREKRKYVRKIKNNISDIETANNNPIEAKETIGNETETKTVSNAKLNEPNNNADTHFDPLGAAVLSDEKDYTKINAIVDDEVLRNDIPEANIPPIEIKISDPNVQDERQPQGSQQPAQPSADNNIGFDDSPISDVNLADTTVNLPKPEQKKYAKALAESCMEVYEMLNSIVKSAFTYTEEDLDKMAIKGKIDINILYIRLPMDNTGAKSITVLYYIQNMYNMQIDAACSIDADWRKEVIELLTEIFIQNNIGMSPLTRLLFLVGKDFVLKTIAIINAKKGLNEILKYGGEALKEKMIKEPTYNLSVDDQKKE